MGCSSSVKPDSELEQKFFASLEAAVKQTPKVDLTKNMNNEFYNIVKQNKNPLFFTLSVKKQNLLASAKSTAIGNK